jgi:hypothetical protein
MRTALQRWLCLVMVLPAGTVFAAEAEHGLSQSAVKIDRWGSFITNSMVVSWVVAIGLIIFARVATRNMKRVPGGAQNFLEWLVEVSTVFWKVSLALIWSNAHFGSLRPSSSLFSAPIGWA